MISTNQFKNGLAIKLDDESYHILEYQHVKPGKGAAFVRTKLKNLKTGAVIAKKFRAGVKVEELELEKKEMQFLYSSGTYYFMDNKTYEQIEVDESIIGKKKMFLKEGDKIKISLLEKKPVMIELPIFVEFDIVKTDPGLKGDTASGGTKPAEIETGAVIQVPLFIKEGDRIRIDTRSEEYITRL